jgi:hypothetical protein
MALAAVSAMLLVTPAAASASDQPPASIGSGLGSTTTADNTAAQVCGIVALKAGFGYKSTVAGYPQIVVAVAVALAESSCNPTAKGSNGPTSGCPNGSVDRGLWQINSCYHSEVSDACAYQIQCNANAAFNISSGGTNWSPWSTYNSGAWRSHIDTAKAAVVNITFQLKNQADGTCLTTDGSQARDGGRIWQWACNSSSNFQRWTVLDNYGERFILKNVATGTCLAGNGSGGSGAPVHQWTCDKSGSYQQWWVNGSGKLNTNGNADAIFVNNANGLCLDDTSASTANGTLVLQLTCYGGVYEQWN